MGQPALNLGCSREDISQVPSSKRFGVGFWKQKQVTCYTQATSYRMAWDVELLWRAMDSRFH